MYIRGLRTWAGFDQIGIEYVRDDRHAGTTSLRFFHNFTWAKKAIVNFSYKPLEYISTVASIFVVLSCCAGFVYLYKHFRYGAPRGFSTLILVMLIFGAIQLLALSIIGEYLIRIFQEVKGRPPYLIKEIVSSKTVEKNKRASAIVKELR